MANINHFKGEWHIHWIEGVALVMDWGWKIVIGTGELDTRTPYVGDDGEVCTGFVIYERIGEQDWTLYTTSHEWGPLVLVDGQLRWIGTGNDGLPLRIYLSAAEGVSREGPFVSLYGSTLRGDPDQVAVWGANDSPPKPRKAGG
jgi:hypothetical protein